MENLLAVLLQARDTAHVQHWKTKSFAKHLALGELYELLANFADELAEMTMGDGIDIGTPTWDQGTVWNKDDPVAFLAQLHGNLENLKSTMPQKDWLVNKYEELQGEVARVKYKIDNLA